MDILHNKVLSSNYQIRYARAQIIIFFRDMEKRGSLKGINLFILILKVILDAVSRILLFSTWLYVINGGQFSSWITVTAYYFTLIILLVFNVTFSWKTENLYSSKYWIGNKNGKILKNLSCISRCDFEFI